MNAFRSWIGVHRWRASASLLGIGAMTAVATRSVSIERLGVQPLVSPVAVALLVPVVLAVAVGVGCIPPMPTLPDPSRAKVARWCWVIALTGCAAAVGILGVVGVQEPTAAAVLRNILIACALSVGTVVLGFPAFTWFAPLLYTAAAMQFGGTGEDDQYWWAVMIDPQCTTRALAGSSAIFGAVAVVYAIGRQLR